MDNKKSKSKSRSKSRSKSKSRSRSKAKSITAAPATKKFSDHEIVTLFKKGTQLNAQPSTGKLTEQRHFGFPSRNNPFAEPPDEHLLLFATTYDVDDEGPDAAISVESHERMKRERKAVLKIKSFRNDFRKPAPLLPIVVPHPYIRPRGPPPIINGQQFLKDAKKVQGESSLLTVNEATNTSRLGSSQKPGPSSVKDTVQESSKKSQIAYDYIQPHKRCTFPLAKDLMTEQLDSHSLAMKQYHERNSSRKWRSPPLMPSDLAFLPSTSTELDKLLHDGEESGAGTRSAKTKSKGTKKGQQSHHSRRHPDIKDSITFLSTSASLASTLSSSSSSSESETTKSGKPNNEYYESPLSFPSRSSELFTRHGRPKSNFFRTGVKKTSATFLTKPVHKTISFQAIPSDIDVDMAHVMVATSSYFDEARRLSLEKVQQESRPSHGHDHEHHHQEHDSTAPPEHEQTTATMASNDVDNVPSIPVKLFLSKPSLSESTTAFRRHIPPPVTPAPAPVPVHYKQILKPVLKMADYPPPELSQPTAATVHHHHHHHEHHEHHDHHSSPTEKHHHRRPSTRVKSLLLRTQTKTATAVAGTSEEPQPSTSQKPPPPVLAPTEAAKGKKDKAGVADDGPKILKPYTDWHAKFPDPKRKLVPFVDFDPYHPIPDDDLIPPSQRKKPLEKMWSRPILQEQLKLSGLTGEVTPQRYKCPMAQQTADLEAAEQKERHAKFASKSQPYNPYYVSTLTRRPPPTMLNPNKASYLISYTKPPEVPSISNNYKSKSSSFPKQTCFTRHHALAVQVEKDEPAVIKPKYHPTPLPSKKH